MKLSFLPTVVALLTTYIIESTGAFSNSGDGLLHRFSASTNIPRDFQKPMMTKSISKILPSSGSYRQKNISRKILFMSSSNEGTNKENQTNKWRRLKGKLNPINLILGIVNQANKRKSVFVTKFKSLSKRGKLLVTIQLFTLMLIFGTGTKQLISNVRGNPAANMRLARSKPVELPYSVFMDFVEKSGKVRFQSKLFMNKRIFQSCTEQIFFRDIWLAKIQH